VVAHCFDQWAPRQLPESERAGKDRRYQRGIMDGVQGDEDGAVGEAIDEVDGAVLRKVRLANTRRPGERKEPDVATLQLRQDACSLFFPADQWRERHRQRRWFWRGH